ncbi:MAG: methyltransferase domain-containing protein [Leptospiraceae bacterium]|nr:methyltransferase domain-containing protein [Leptospiraceae bacterium]
MNKINLGCGNRFHKDWLNLDFVSNHPDVIAHDLKKGLPYSDGSFTAIYHSHVLEHFTIKDAKNFMKECYRILEKDGVIRMVIPDLEMICRLYIENLEKAISGDKLAEEKYQWMKIELLDQLTRNHSGGEMLEYWKQNPMPAEEFVIERTGGEVLGFLRYYRSLILSNHETSPNERKSIEKKNKSILNIWKEKIIEYLIQNTKYKLITEEMENFIKIGKFRLSGEIHQWMYDRYSVSKLIDEVGFKDIKQVSASESDIPNFQSYNLDTDEDGRTRKPDSLFMEARK